MISQPAQPSLVQGLLRRPSLWFAILGSIAVIVIASKLMLSRDAQPLPVLSSVPAFEFTNQHGALFGSKSLEGQVWVANFIFTRCPTICPTFTAKMAAIQKRGPAGLQLVSMTVDPEYDTPERLEAYAAKYHAAERWSFLTGERAVLNKVIVEGMLQPMDSPVDPSNLAAVVHGSYFVLVDKHLKVRGFYQFNEPASVDQVVRDAARLLSE